MLSPEKYLAVISMTHVVTVDLLIKNRDGKIMLCKHKNAPVKGFYFVPGGTIYKDETVKEGAYRMLLWEFGINIKLRSRCVSEHIYDTNFCDARDSKGNIISTRYICFAFDADLDENIFEEQHSDILWLTPEEILTREDVHEYIKLYYTPNAYNRFEI